MIKINWDELLPICAMAYNGSIHSSTGYSPFFLMFGREMRMPLELVLPHPEEEVDQLPEEDFVDSFVHQMRRTFAFVYSKNREHLQAALAEQKHSYDKKKNEFQYKPGDGVWLYNPRRRVGRTPKLDSPWEPVPYTVVENLGDVLCHIQRNRRCKGRVVHKDKLLPVRGKHDGQWVFTLPKKTEMQIENFDGLSQLFKENIDTKSTNVNEYSQDLNIDTDVVPMNYDGPVTRSMQRRMNLSSNN